MLSIMRRAIGRAETCYPNVFWFMKAAADEAAGSRSWDYCWARA